MTSATATPAMSAAAAAANRKRLYIAEDADADAVTNKERLQKHGGPWVHRDDWIDGEISPRCIAPAGWGNARVMAMPKTRRKGSAAAGAGGGDGSLPLKEQGQENMVVDDFDEADAAFLEEMEF